MRKLSFPGLSIKSPVVLVEAINFRPVTWPPSPDWPVVIDRDGKVVSRWADHFWILDAWAGKRCILHFGDGLLNPRTPKIDKRNADLLRLVVGWWLYGPKSVNTASTLKARFEALRPLFAFCSSKGIEASRLSHYPQVVEQLHTIFLPSSKYTVIPLLHELLGHSKDLGFAILSRKDIGRLAASIADASIKQTAYIPPRIWLYQLTRLRECIDDFVGSVEKFRGLYEHCIAEYKEAGLLDNVGKKQDSRRSPLTRTGGRSKFEVAAQSFGVAEILQKWAGKTSSGKLRPLGIHAFTSYLTLVNWASYAYILNFTLMRSEEAIGLKHDCFIYDDDPRFGRIYLIEGKTSKTISDDAALWITAEESQVAVAALNAISGIRNRGQAFQPEGRLMQGPIEPWSSANVIDSRNLPSAMNYSTLMVSYPLLFDAEEMRITSRDLELARAVTPTLDSRFAVGAVWPLAWHQLRRTGAVNMQASGLVSDASVQFQLKQLTRAMALYYGRNYSRVRLEEKANSLYLLETYAAVAREIQETASMRFISPHGQKRKNEIVRLIPLDDMKLAVKLAKKGGVACREVLLGACMNTEPCSFGGIDSVVHCGGGDTGRACPDILYDKSRLEQVAQLDRLLDERLIRVERGSPMEESLNAQKRSVQNYFTSVLAKGA